MLICHFFGKVSIRSFAHFLTGAFFALLLSVEMSLCIWDTRPFFIRYMFFLACYLSFHFLNNFFVKAEIFNFSKVQCNNFFSKNELGGIPYFSVL